MAAGALVLSANVFRFPFLSDDYDFLGRAATLRLSDLLPTQSIAFYRPISREIYFWVLAHLLGDSPLAAHLLNFAIVGAIGWLLVMLVRRASGPAAGRAAGAFFACGAAIPLCVGWISADQDLLCALFLLIALHLVIARKYVGSAFVMAAAIFSKETAVAILPTVAGLAVIRAQGKARERLRILGVYGGLVAGWIAVHPWTRSVLLGTSNIARSDHAYIGFFGASMLTTSLTGIAMTLNVPWLMDTAVWPSQLIPPAAIASALVIMLFFLHPGADRQELASREKPWWLCSGIGGAIALTAIVLTSLTLGRWAPHYTLIPLVGLSMVVGPALARTSKFVTITAILVYLWLGIGLRGNSLAPGAASEPNFAASAAALRKVERGFKALHPTLPASNVYVSVQVRGAGGLYRDLFRNQTLRVWYGEPGIWVLDPNRRRPSDRPEFLFWISPDLSVFEVSLGDLAPRGPTSSVDLLQYEKTLRGYSYGLAAGGDVERASFILTHLPEVSSEVTAFDRRSAAMLLYAAGRTIDADRLVNSTARFPNDAAVEAVVALLAEPVRGLDLDVAAMHAFGLDASDTVSVRSVMRQLDRGRYLLAASRFARRLLSMQPGDPEANAVLERDRLARSQQITVPIPYDIPQ